MIAETSTGGALLELIDAAYAAGSASSSWPRFLERLAGAIGAAQLHLFLRCTGRGHPGLIHAFGVEASWANAYLERYAVESPFRGALGHAEEGRLDVGKADEWVLAESFYREWMAPQGLRHPFALYLEPRNGTFTLLSGFRSKQAGEFREADLELLRELRPHLQRALLLERDLRSAARARDAALAGLDELRRGWLLLSADGHVLATNRRADELLARDASLRAGEAPSGRAAALVEWATKALAAGPVAAVEPLELESRDGEPALRATLLPLGGGADDSADRDAVAVLLEAGAEDGVDRLAQLRAQFALTPAEARVVGQLARGRRLSEIAGELGISINTVRGHLKQVFAKTGTHRQAELVRLALGGPA